MTASTSRYKRPYGVLQTSFLEFITASKARGSCPTAADWTDLLDSRPLHLVEDDGIKNGSVKTMLSLSSPLVAFTERVLMCRQIYLLPFAACQYEAETRNHSSVHSRRPCIYDTNRLSQPAVRCECNRLSQPFPHSDLYVQLPFTCFRESDSSCLRFCFRLRRACKSLARSVPTQSTA